MEKLKGKITFKKAVKYIIIEFFIAVLLFPLYIFYGPFKDVRNLITSISMSTGNHKWIAEMFLSDEKINEILDSENYKLIGANEGIGKVNIGESDESIQRINIECGKFDGYALIIKDPMSVKIGCTAGLGKTGQAVEHIAEECNAIAAINGGGFSTGTPSNPQKSQNADSTNDGKISRFGKSSSKSFRVKKYSGSSVQTDGIPLGILITDGEVLYPEDTDEYDKEEECVFSIDSTGKMYVGPASVNDLIKMNSKEALSFGPTLVVNGNAEISKTTLTGVNPRTAIGQRDDGSIIFLVIDGREKLKLGASLSDVQKVMLQLGATNAMCLDGGGSSTMYYDGEVINNPSDNERSVPDIVYVGQEE